MTSFLTTLIGAEGTWGGLEALTVPSVALFTLPLDPATLDLLEGKACECLFSFGTKAFARTRTAGTNLQYTSHCRSFERATRRNPVAPPVKAVCR